MKNNMLRMASAMLVLTLLTTGVIGGTFAKYVTVATASDTARVAKWGVVIEASGSLYSDAYATQTVAPGGDLPASWNDKSDNKKISVAAGTEKDNIVAPGTKSYENGLSFSVSGQPEVAVKVETAINAEDIFLKAGHYGVLAPINIGNEAELKNALSAHPGYVYREDSGYKKVADDDIYVDGMYYVLMNDVNFTAGADYFPVQYTLKKTGAVDPYVEKGTAVKVAEELVKIVGTGVSANPDKIYQKTYTSSSDFAANTDLAAAGSLANGSKLGDERIEWNWKIEDGDNDAAKAETNKKDTILGYLIAAKETTPAPESFVVAVDDTDGRATKLITAVDADDYTVSNNDGTVVANLRTRLDITLSVTQID